MRRVINESIEHIFEKNKKIVINYLEHILQKKSNVATSLQIACN